MWVVVDVERGAAVHRFDVQGSGLLTEFSPSRVRGRLAVFHRAVGNFQLSWGRCSQEQHTAVDVGNDDEHADRGAAQPSGLAIGSQNHQTS